MPILIIAAVYIVFVLVTKVTSDVYDKIKGD